jgi:mannose-6-phosphate isomerase-like protein (cupin superfamily)
VRRGSRLLSKESDGGNECQTFGVRDWMKTNFDDLRDVSPEDVRIQWRFAREALRSRELGVSRFTYAPGARMPWGHRHREQEEVYVVVGGSGRAKLDDEIIELKVSDVLRVAPAVIRSFEAGPDGLDVICIGGHKPEGGDTVRFEEFWV